MNHRLAVSIFVVAALAPVLLFVFVANAQGDGRILIGLTAPAGLGQGTRGEELRAGATLAVETIVRGGGIHGVPLRLKVEDSGAEPRAQVAAFTALTESGNVPVVITGGEDEADIIRGIAQVRNVLVLANTARSDLLRKGELTMKIGRSPVSANNALIRFLKERKITRLMVLRGAVSWASQVAEHLKLLSSGGAFSISAEEPLWDGAGHLRPQAVTSILKAKPELVYIIGDPSEQARAVEILNKHRIRVALVHLFGCEKQSLPRLSVYRGPQYSLDTTVLRHDGETVPVQQVFAKRFPKLDFTVDAAIAYDAVMMVADAYKNGAGTPEAVQEFLLRKGSFDGAAGKLELLPSGDSTRPLEINVLEPGGCKSLGLNANSSGQ